MPRRSKWEHLKPEVWRLLSEGFTPKQIKDQLWERGEKIPKTTVYTWAKEFEGVREVEIRKQTNNKTGMIPKRLPIDPESPVENIINKLWDLYEDADTLPSSITSVKVKILDTLLKARQYQDSKAMDLESSEDDCPDLLVEIAAPSEAETA